jgi:hypothetical protein
VFEAPGMRFSLVSRFPLARQGTGVATEFLLHPGEPSTFILRQVAGDSSRGAKDRLRDQRGGTIAGPASPRGVQPPGESCADTDIILDLAVRPGPAEEF